MKLCFSIGAGKSFSGHLGMKILIAVCTFNESDKPNILYLILADSDLHSNTYWIR